MISDFGLPSQHTTTSATLMYCGRIDGRPRFDVPDPARTNVAFEPHEIPIHDVRAVSDRLTIDKAGFEFTKHPCAEALDPDFFKAHTQFRHADHRTAVAYQDSVAEFLKKVTGAAAIVPVSGFTYCRTSHRAKNKSWAVPASFVHLDFTEKSAYDFLRWSVPEEFSSTISYRHFVIYQTWRAISPGPQDNTLAICDGSSVPAEDAVVMDSVVGPEHEPAGKFESRLCRYRPDHRWYYMSNMEPEDLLIFKGFDSRQPLAMNAMHSAFDNKLADDNSAPRQSIEARFFAFFD